MSTHQGIGGRLIIEGHTPITLTNWTIHTPKNHPKVAIITITGRTDNPQEMPPMIRPGDIIGETKLYENQDDENHWWFNGIRILGRTFDSTQNEHDINFSGRSNGKFKKPKGIK